MNALMRRRGMMQMEKGEDPHYYQWLKGQRIDRANANVGVAFDSVFPFLSSVAFYSIDRKLPIENGVKITSPKDGSNLVYWIIKADGTIGVKSGWTTNVTITKDQGKWFYIMHWRASTVYPEEHMFEYQRIEWM